VFLEDGLFFPLKGMRIFVVGSDAGIDMQAQLFLAGEAGAFE